MALAGHDGKQASKILQHTIQTGAATLGTLTEKAVRRYLSRGRPGDDIFTPEEVQQLADQIAATLATADLLGRYRIIKRLDQAKAFHEANKFADHYVRFADVPTDFSAFASSPLGPFSPVAALKWFRSLLPRVLNPDGWIHKTIDHAFQRALDCIANVTVKVHKAIGDVLEDGGGVPQGTDAVQTILDAAGVTPDQPHYAETVFRTNAHDAYQGGAEAQLADPDVKDHFPAWQWSTIMDGRQRDAHGERNERYYPNSVSFFDVRDKDGFDGFNCRCSTIPVYKDDWKELKANGADFSAFAEDAEGHDHGVDGKFVTKGGGGTAIKDKPLSSHPGAVVELHEKAEGAARKRLARFKAQFGKITDVPVAKQVKAGLNWCKEKTGQFYNLLEKRYGRPTAIACLATGQAAGWATTIAGAVAGVPIVIPGLSILGSLPAVAAAEIYLQLRGKHSEDQPVDMAKVKSLAEAFEKKIMAEFAAYIKGHKFAEVPAVRQKTPWTCGPASLLAVCKAYGINTTEEAIRDLAGTTEEGGTNPEQMAAAARALGLIAEPMEPMNFNHLVTCMDRGYPVIACIQAWGTPKEMERDQAGHWVVFTGLDGDKISLMDPAVDDGKCLRLETKSLMENWHDKDANGVPYDHFGLIIKGKA